MKIWLTIKLKNRLASWPSYVNEWTEEEEAVFRFVRTNLNPYLSDFIKKFPDDPNVDGARKQLDSLRAKIRDSQEQSEMK